MGAGNNRRPRSGSTSSANGGGGGGNKAPTSTPKKAATNKNNANNENGCSGGGGGGCGDPAALALHRRDRFGRTELHCLASSPPWTPPPTDDYGVVGAAPAPTISPLVRARDLLESAVRLDREHRRNYLLRRQNSSDVQAHHQSPSSSAGRGGGGRPRSNSHSGGGGCGGRPRSNSGGCGPSLTAPNQGRNPREGDNRNARELLTSRDAESGYTALHRAAYSRDICMVLLLLRYAALRQDEDDDEGLDLDLDRGEVVGNNELKKKMPKKKRRNNHANFMTLLECTGPPPTDAINNNGNNNNGGSFTYRRSRSNSFSSPSPTRTVEEMSSIRDAEGLTPLRLLGELYSSDLGRTVDGIRMRAKMGWAARAAATEAATEEARSDSLLLGGYENGGQFHPNEEESMLPDEDTISFPTYRPAPPRAVAGTTTANVLPAGASETTCTYGTEVVTFGRADHAALGHFHHSAGSSSCSSSNDLAASPSSSSSPSVSSSSSSQSILLGRVEEFALPARGQILEEEGARSGAAVAVAAAAHHTLVATANGHLYAFGLGKGGRLGTGDERHQLMPRRVLGPLARRRVSSIAASENHSLCSTSDGSVYAWGSNRFGQLGVTRGTGGANSSTASNATLSLPTRVDDLKRVFVTKVAGGDRHSVALARDGAVYCWGDNRAGQLGWTPYRASSEPAPFASSGTTVTSSAPLTTHVHRVGRVEALWSANPQRLAIDIAAGDKTTLSITRAPQREGFANCVYGWGHGSYNPIRINFPTDDNSASQQLRSQRDSSGGSNFSSKRDVVDPVGIACAKYHNVAIAADGRVYTWGVHTNPLPRETPASSISDSDAGWNRTTKKSSSPKVSSSGGAFVSSNTDHYKVTSPQLVTAMLPENGGGRATAVSASEHHTAVLTTTGHLFTWGAPDSSHVMGHKGVKYQPQPKRVPGVVRAISVAAARDHTALLIGTTVPPEGSVSAETCTGDNFAEGWPTRVPSLQRLAEKAAARHVDLYNVVPVSIMAERLHATGLIRYCAEFVSSNLDGVLAVAKKNDLDCLIDERLTSLSLPVSVSCEDMDSRDHTFWPRMGKVDENLFASCSSSGFLRGGEASAKGRPTSETKGTLSSTGGTGSKVACSERMALLMAERPDLNNPTEVAARYHSLSKVARSLKKKLNLVAELEKTTQQSLATGASCDDDCSRAVSELTMEQHEKLARKPMLQVDLATLEPALEEIERRMVHFNLCKRKGPGKTLQLSHAEKSSTKVPSEESVPRKLFPTEEEAAAQTKLAADQGRDVATEVGSAVARCRCEVCDITCPDLSSLSLHMNGRKHRNRVRHLEDIDKRETAARMMETKQRQMMLKSAREVDDSKMPAKVASNVFRQQALDEASAEMLGNNSKPEPLRGKYGEPQKDELSIQPRYSLAPRPAVDESCMAEKIVPWSGKSALVSSEAISRNKKTRVKVPVESLQKIIQEEEQKKSTTASIQSFCDVPIKNKTETDVGQRVQKSTARMNQSSFGMDAPDKSKTGNSLSRLSTSQPSTSLSLSSFLEKETVKAKSGKDSQLGSQSPRHHPWSKQNDRKESTSSCRKSFHEIQREEEDLKASEKRGAAKDAKWFIQRRERAPSIGEIQKKEEEERQLNMLIEEQKAIEAQIAREVQEKERDKKKSSRAKPRRGKKSERRAAGGKGRSTENGEAPPSLGQAELGRDTGHAREKKAHRKRNGGRAQRRCTQKEAQSGLENEN